MSIQRNRWRKLEDLMVMKESAVLRENESDIRESIIGPKL